MEGRTMSHEATIFILGWGLGMVTGVALVGIVHFACDILERWIAGRN